MARNLYPVGKNNGWRLHAMGVLSKLFNSQMMTMNFATDAKLREAIKNQAHVRRPLSCRNGRLQCSMQT